MQHCKKHRQKGFTIQEMLFVILISVVLLAVSIVGIVTYMHRLQITTLDNSAKEIFMAAQNRAILLHSGHRLEHYVIQTDGSNRIDHVDVDAGSGETTQITAYYIHSSEQEKIEKLLPQETIESNLWQGDFYIIYEPESGSVVDVLFGDETLPIENNFPNFYKEWRVASRDVRMDHRPMIGYYGGEPSKNGTAISLRTPVINIYNENTLRAEVTYWLPRTLAMINEDKNVKLNVTLHYQDQELTLDQADAEKKEEPALAYFAYTYTWILDSLEKDEIQFKELFPKSAGISTYGRDFTIHADVLYTGDLSVNGASKMAQDNSLFANGSDGKTAYISYLRHLQNLDKEFSKVDQKVNAIQKADILEKADYYFKPIQNAQLQSYDGAKFSIYGLHIKEDGTKSAGLFGVLEGTQSKAKELRNMRLVGTTVSAGSGSAGTLMGVGKHVNITNCQVYWENQSEQSTNLRDVLGDSINGLKYQVVGSGSIGGLVGKLTNAVVQDCSASTLIQGNGAVGGLIGETSGLTLKSSYAASYLQGTSVAGLIGNLNGNANISGSYAVGFMDSDIHVAAQAAGLSLGTGTAQVHNSYSAMLFTVGEQLTNYPLCQKGTYHNTYYLASDLFHSEQENEALAKSYGELTDPTKWDTLFDAKTFVSKGATKSHPYNLQTTLQLTTFIYPGIASLDHWGDWGAQFQDGSLVYYERYVDNTYGFSGGGKSYLADKTIIEDGYAVAYQSTKPISGIGAVLDVTYWTDGRPKKERFSYGNNQSGVIYEITNVPDATEEEGNYYLLTLPDNVVNTNYAAKDFYQKISIADIDAHTEDSYYYNPHFANAILPYEDGLDLNQLAKQKQVEVRSPRHLYMLSRFDTYYTSNHQYYFLQEQDLDYGVYIGYNLFTGDWHQTPIGINARTPFRGSYYGNSYLIRGVKTIATDDRGKNYQYMGLFGYNTSVLRDIVYEMNQDAAFSVTQSGSSSKTLYAGGLVGYNGGTIDNCAVFDVKFHANCYMYSTVYLGGLVGRNEGNIRASTADVADVSAHANLSNAYVGGFVGRNTAGGMIRQSYAVGKVSASRARYGDVYACGFAGQNEATINRSYAAVSVLVDGEGERYGFSPDKSTQCIYLNDGNFTYRGEHYAAQYADPSATPVTWEQLNGQEENDAVNAWGMTKDAAAFQSIKKYPYPGTVKDREDNPIHYGQWPDRMDLGTMGVYYWEKLNNGNENYSYHFSVLSVNENQVLESSTLSTVHGDGATVIEYGYGYFHQTDTAKPTLHSQEIYWDNNAFDPQTAPTNQEVNDALSALMSGQYNYYSYNTWQEEQNRGLHLIMTEQNQSRIEPPVGTWTLTQGNLRLEVKLNPFFADSMSHGTESLPGTEENPYQVRSIEQLQFINWYAKDGEKTVNRVAVSNGEGYLFLNNHLTGNNERQYAWVQTHDLNGSHIKNYIPIASIKDTMELGTVIAWFSGSYDGNDYAIQEVSISTEQINTTGLFGVTVNADLKNIVMYSPSGKAKITASNREDSWYAIGGLVGLAANTEGSTRSIRNCTVAGYTIIDNNAYCKWGGGGVGGLVGICNMALENCAAVTNIQLSYSHSDKYRNIRVGGIAGSCQQSITKCYSGGTVMLGTGFRPDTKSRLHVGGITGGFFMKTLDFDGGNVPSLEAGLNENQKVPANRVTRFENCYTYLEMDDAVKRKADSQYNIGGLGEIYRQESESRLAHYNNCYYLANAVNTTTVDGSAVGVHNCTYSDLSAGGTAFQSLQNVGFKTVTTKTSKGENISGRYSFGISTSHLGKDYPFPTILTQSSDIVTGGRADVHYGEWPLAGIRREYGALPVDLDLFADYKEVENGAIWSEKLTLSTVDDGGQWSVASQNVEIADAVLQEGDASNNRMLQVTAKSAGSTVITVSYQINGKTYDLPIEVNVTAQLRLVAKAASPILVFTDELAPATQTTTTPTANVPLELHDKNGKKLPENLQIELLNCNVEFDPAYFSQATIQQKDGWTLQAMSKIKTGTTQMTAGYDFAYLGKNYHATSVLLLQVVKPEVTLPTMEFIFEKDAKIEQTKQYDGKDSFVLNVDGQPKPVSHVRIVAFEEVVAEFKEMIWAEWAKNPDGTEQMGTVSVTAYPQTLYPVSAIVKIQFQFECEGNTYTLWQNMPIEVMQKAEEAQL